MTQKTGLFGLNLPAIILATATGLTTHEQRKAKFRAYCEQVSGVEGQFPSTFIPPAERETVRAAIEETARKLGVASTAYVKAAYVALNNMPAEPPKVGNGHDTAPVGAVVTSQQTGPGEQAAAND
jgi:hypothetical protein